MKIGITQKEYARNQANKKRQRGTRISKKAMRAFVRGIDIRMRSGVEEAGEMYFKSEKDRYAILANYFFKYLTDHRSFDDKNTLENSPIVALWIRDDGQPQVAWNLSAEYAKVTVANAFLPLAEWFRKLCQNILSQTG